MSSTVLNQFHNHYLSTYTPKGGSKYDTHKKSELRSVYNSIVKMNKESPLYLMDHSRETKQFAVNVKEQARLLGNTISSLGAADQSTLLSKKTAYSTNENIATAEYIGPEKTSDDHTTPEITLEVQTLASSQVNLGTFLPDGKPPLAPGSYSFDVNINDLNYEFQFSIKEDETNLDIQKRLERLINSADIGLEASIIGDNNARSALRLSSTSTGISEGKTAIFHISDDNTSKESGTVVYFGLNYMAIEPRNAQFTLNGIPHSTNSNHFTIENEYEITLTGVSTEEEDSAFIGLKTDIDSLADNVHTLIQGYNSFLKAVHESSDTLSRGQKLIKDLNGISTSFKYDLDTLGIHTAEDGTLAIDDALLKQTASEKDPVASMQSVKEFANSLMRKTRQISLNPMDYVDKTMVAYKNPGRNFATPYITSQYSGMLFSYYC